MGWSELRRLPRIVAAALLLIPAAGFAQGSAISGAVTETGRRADEAPAGNAARGKQLFHTIGCYECHGYQAQGTVSSAAPTAGPRLAPSPMPFRRFAQYVRAPRLMPRYSDKGASDQDLADIYAFLLSVPAPPAVNSIPLLAPSQFPGITTSPK